MPNNPLDVFSRPGNFQRIDNAFVEEVSCSNPSDGFLIVRVPNPGSFGNAQRIRLNFNRSTVVMNSFGRRICLCCVQRGMWVSAIFSSQMTRSIPPQATAFIIVTQRRAQQPTSSSVTRILSIDWDNRFILTGNPDFVRDQTRYVFSNQTVVRDSRGREVGLRALRPGQRVRITHGNFETASIPPQATAFEIQIL